MYVDLLLTQASADKFYNVMENACILTCGILRENYSTGGNIIEASLTLIPTIIASQNLVTLG